LRGEDKCVAIDAVQYNQLKIFRVAKKFSILQQTLGGRVSRRVAHGTKPVPTMREESELVQRLNMNRAHYRLMSEIKGHMKWVVIEMQSDINL